MRLTRALPAALAAVLLPLATGAGAQSHPGAAPLAPPASFGGAVAVAGGDVLVGEPENLFRPGLVYVYREGPGGWSEVQRLTAPEGAPGDGFGHSLAAGDEVALVGARGAAHAFHRDASGRWAWSARLAPPGEADEEIVVALGGDLAVLGAPDGRGSAGEAWTFRAGASGAWGEAVPLPLPEGLSPGAGFGEALATDGDQVLVGASGYIPTGEPNRSRGARPTGAVFAYRAGPDDGWTAAGVLTPDGAQGGGQFGAALALAGGQAYVGAPGEAWGVVYVWGLDEAEGTGPAWRPRGLLLPFDGDSRMGFGSALAVGSAGLWVGAPQADGSRGAIYVFRFGPGSVRWAGVDRIVSAGLGTRYAFGRALAAAGEVAAAGIPGADYGAGTVMIFERGSAGAWTSAATVLSEAEGLDPVTDGEVECAADGTAALFDCGQVDLLSFLPVKDIGGDRGVRTNDVWGWTDPRTGKEYALVGLLDRTSFVDVSDPLRPVFVGSLPKTEGTPGSTWRDVKVYRDHAYVVADAAGAHGIQVFDLTRLREFGGEPLTFAPDTTYDPVHSAHNIVINTETGFAYAVGSSSGGETCGGGLHMVDIRDPKRPSFAGCFAAQGTGRAGTGYTHDAQCVAYSGPDERYRGREICFGANETALSIADVTEKASPVDLARAEYPNVGYSHQGWLSEDQRYFYMDDELDEIQGTVSRTRTLIWDVAELDDPQLVGEFLGTTEASDHNLYVVGDLIFQSNYQAGLRILDISDRESPREVGWFDTVPYGTNTPGFGGSWSNYPFFESGIVVVTSGSEGLFVLRPRMRPTVF